MNTSLRIVDIIADKRDGKSLSGEQISTFINEYAQGRLPDYQAAAWCMAVFFRGLKPEELAHLVRAMICSGDSVDFSRFTGPFADKHSTGGVGDKISLILAPLAATCGVKVPMMSGRALAHTGGTLDKLDAIPGYSTRLSPEQFVDGVNTVGFAMMGQSEQMVPADRKMYALRDVTATVESIPLITASILSKKFAEGAETLVMDVKCGEGAFMKTMEQARTLAESLVRTGESLGRRVVAVITDMSEPLGRTVGNFLEVEEAVAVLHGDGPDDLMEVTLRLTAWMLVASGMEKDVGTAEERCRMKLADGSALAKFRENAAFQGARLDELDAMLGRARAQHSRLLFAKKAGFVRHIDALAVGMAGVSLGVGRNTAADAVEALSGIELLKKRGDAVASGEVLMCLWAEEKSRLDEAMVCLEEAVSIDHHAPPARGSLILEEMA